MSRIDDLRAAGFSDGEVSAYATRQRATLASAGFNDDEINSHLGAPLEPDTAAANKAFGAAAANSIRFSGGNLGDDVLTGVKGGLENFAAPFEAAANAGTGLVFGFPAYIGAALSGLVQKHLLGIDIDPKEVAEAVQGIATYKPMTQKGQALAEQVMWPLEKVAEGASYAGHKATDALVKAGDPGGMAAPVGAVTDATVQMLAPMLFGELGRKLGGQTVSAADMKNVAKIVAGTEAPHEAVAVVERSLRAVYDQTGIGPFTVAAEAAKDPALHADLVDPTVEIPKAMEQFVEKAPEPDAPVPGDGLPVLDVSPTEEGVANEAAAGDEATPASPDTPPADAAAEAPEAPRNVPGSEGLNAGIDPTAVLREISGMANSAAAVARRVTDGVVNTAIGREVVRSVMPMSTGAAQAKAVAQTFANAMRNARFQWQRIGDYLEKNFTPDERQAMWNAADEQNVLMMNGAETAGRGLDALTADQRGVMLELHDLANGLWERAKAAGMVQGEGLPFWTPRMAVLIGEDGHFMKPPGGGARATSSGEGANVSTSASSLKQRKHLLAEDTEAAMKATLGDNAVLVRDILTMPLAMSRMGQAIAGRELISQLKELGQVSGKDIVSESLRPGFATIDHPAFTTYRPEFVAGVDGRMKVRLDEDGQPVMVRTPMLISDDWIGPLKAVLSSQDGPVYKALMLAKSKAMSAIMISPLSHNMVIWGRALAYDPAAIGTLKGYFAGHALARDGALMGRAISDGLVPIGANRSSMIDITDVARGLGREGGWGDPNQSWINLSAQKLGNVFADGLGDSIKARLDAFGDFWHHTLLWKQVGAVQMYIYNDYHNHMTALGHPPEVAGPIAANLANRYAGAVASENSSAWVRKALNVVLFSRSFNVGNIGAVHDAAFGLPEGLRAKMFADAGPDAAAAGLTAAAGKARMGLVADLGMSMLLTAVTSAAVAKLLFHQSAEDIANGYGRRLRDMVQNIGEHPFSPGAYNPYRALPTWENEPGKEDRIDLGAQPGGQHEYLRLPTGKVVEDTIGWLLHAPDTFVKKLSPLMKGTWQAVTNDKGFGVPVADPESGTLQHIAQGLQHVIEAQVPMDTLKTLYDVAKGVGTPLDKDKLLGFASGFSTSKGNPHGPEEAVYLAQQERISAARKYAMEAVRDDVKNGRDADAFDRLKAAGLTPRDIVMTINGIKNPRQGMSKQQARRFAVEATPEDRASMERANRQSE